MSKRLTKAEKIRRYMEQYPDAPPKEIAKALGVKVEYVHVLRSVDKKNKAEGKPIRRIKNTYTKRKTLAPIPSFVNPPPKDINEMIDKAVQARKELSITMIEPKHDPVNHPAHYKVGGIETIDYIKAKLTPDEFRGYLKGNLLKYSSRIGHKGAAQLDAGKAGWYANALMQAIETQNA